MYLCVDMCSGTAHAAPIMSALLNEARTSMGASFVGGEEEERGRGRGGEGRALGESPGRRGRARNPNPNGWYQITPGPSPFTLVPLSPFVPPSPPTRARCCSCR